MKQSLLACRNTFGNDCGPGAPRLLFEGRFNISNTFGLAPFDVTADGQQFLMVIDTALVDGEAESPQINIVLNWFEELKERVPVT